MMKSNEMSMPDSLLRSMEATEYALRAMEMMDEAVWILKTITSRYGDIIPQDEMEDIKGIIGRQASATRTPCTKNCTKKSFPMKA